MVIILASPWMQVGRGIVTVISCLFILGVINMTKIDALTYGIPQEYLPFMLIGALVVGIISAYFFRKKKHDDAADNKSESGKIASTNALPYDQRYDAMTICALILGIAVGMYGAPMAVDQVFINAGVFIYAGMAAILAGVFVWVFGYIFHFGIQKAVIDAAKYAVDTTQVIKDSAGDFQQAVDNISQVIPDLNKKP